MSKDFDQESKLKLKHCVKTIIFKFLLILVINENGFSFFPCSLRTCSPWLFGCLLGFLGSFKDLLIAEAKLYSWEGVLLDFTQNNKKVPIHIQIFPLNLFPLVLYLNLLFYLSTYSWDYWSQLKFQDFAFEGKACVWIKNVDSFPIFSLGQWKSLNRMVDSEDLKGIAFQ